MYLDKPPMGHKILLIFLKRIYLQEFTTVSMVYFLPPALTANFDSDLTGCEVQDSKPNWKGTATVGETLIYVIASFMFYLPGHCADFF